MSKIDDILGQLKSYHKEVEKKIGDDATSSDKKILSQIKKEMANTEQLKKVADKEDTDDDKKQINQAKQNLKDVKKLRRSIKVIKKQAGGSGGPNMKNVGKANPRPANSNEGGVRCFIRYNNQGNPYRICDGSKPKDGFTKAPSQITAPITPQVFMDQLDKTYIELTEGQRNEYHRLDMANRRLEERMDDKLQAKYEKVIRNQRKVKREQLAINKLEEKQDALKDREKELDFKKELQKLGKSDVRRNKGSASYKEFRKSFGLKETTIAKRFGKNQKALAIKQGDLQEAKDDYKKSQDLYQTSYKTTNKKVSLSFN